MLKTSGTPGIKVLLKFYVNIKTSDGTSIRNRNRELKISELFLVSESEYFNRIYDSENDSLEFVCLQLKLQSKNIGS